MSTPRVDPANASAQPTARSVGRKLASWMTNLLASGLVLIVGLATGRELLLWWRSPADLATGPLTTVSDDEPPEWRFEEGFFDLRFGAAPLVVRRQVMSGDRAAVQEVLRRHSTELARQVLAQASAPRPKTESAEPARREDDAATRRLLTRLASLQPVAGEPGRWALYEWPNPLPANVVMVDRSTRILAWGLAFPEGNTEGTSGTWSLFSWAEATSEDSTADSDAPHRPPGTTLGLCVTSPDDAALATFQARGGTAWLERHYDDWARQAHGEVTAAWQSTGTLRTARYRLPSGSNVLVQLEEREPALVRGIVTRWPRRTVEKP